MAPGGWVQIPTFGRILRKTCKPLLSSYLDSMWRIHSTTSSKPITVIPLTSVSSVSQIEITLITNFWIQSHSSYCQRGQTYYILNAIFSGISARVSRFSGHISNLWCQSCSSVWWTTYISGNITESAILNNSTRTYAQSHAITYTDIDDQSINRCVVSTSNIRRIMYAKTNTSS